jgi:streptogramin lyase
MFSACSSFSAPLGSGPGAVFGRAATGGVVSSLTIVVPVTALPLGETTAFSVVAKDRSGRIITGAYDHPIVLEAGGLSLSSYSVTDSVAAAELTAGWAPNVAGPAAATLEARVDGRTAVAYLRPGTGFAYYTGGQDRDADFSGFQIVAGPDGDMYYGTIGRRGCPSPCPPLSGAIGRLDPASGAVKEIDLDSEVLGLMFASDGALWFAGGSGGDVYRLPAHSFSKFAMQKIAVPAPSPRASFTPRFLAQDLAGDVWFGDGAGGRALEIPAGATIAPSSIVAHGLPRGPAGTPRVAAFAGGIAVENGGSVDVLDYANGTLDRLDARTGRVFDRVVLPQQRAIGSRGSVGPRFVVTGSATTMWLSFLGREVAGKPLAGGIDRYDANSGQVQSVALPSVPAGDVPDTLSLQGGYLYYADIAAHAVGVVNVQTGRSRLIPTQPFVSFNNRLSPGGIAALADGTAWVTCANGVVRPFRGMCLEHTVYLNGWSLFPGPAFNVGVGSSLSQVVGVMENPALDSGPFVAKTSTAKRCSLTPVVDHNFVVIGVSKGTCLVRVTDARGISAGLAIAVI